MERRTHVTKACYVSPLDLPPTTVDIMWLAGLLEGEACFYFHKFCGVINMNSTDRDVLEQVSKITGGTINDYNYPNRGGSRKPAWQLCLSGYRARRVMEEILPYMGVRRAEKIMTILSKPHWGWKGT